MGDGGCVDRVGDGGFVDRVGEAGNGAGHSSTGAMETIGETSEEEGDGNGSSDWMGRRGDEDPPGAPPKKPARQSSARGTRP